MVETNDLSKLTKMHKYFKSIRNESLSKEELEAQESRMIDLGLKNTEEGNIMTHAEARKKIDQLLYKKSK